MSKPAVPFPTVLCHLPRSLTDWYTIEYERNPNYFKKGLPFFDGMIFTFVRDYNRRLAAMQVGQAQTTEGPTIGTYGNEDPMRIQRETKGRVRGIYIPEAMQTICSCT